MKGRNAKVQSRVVFDGPTRTCVSCRKKNEADKMFRFVRRADGEIVFDMQRKAFGRGAHTCKDRRCVDLAVERRAFARAFKKDVIVDKKTLEQAVS